MTDKTPHKKTSFLSVRLEDDLLERLAGLASQNERTTAGEVRLAIRRHVEDAERVQGRPAIRAEGGHDVHHGNA